MNPLIVNAALTGMVPTKEDNPNVPVTPEEIAEDAARCRRAGAAIVHLHARDEHGRPTWRADVYAEIVRRVRERCPDVVVCVSTSGRLWNEFEKRAEVLDLDGELKPEMASLTLGSLNFPRQASVNDPDMIRRLAERMHERGIVPELEVFDLGMVDYATYLLERGVLHPPLYFNLLLGSLGTVSATPFNLALLARALPPGATWAGAGIGRFQLLVNSLAVASGGHVRVGLEDNLWLDPGKRQPASNLALVERLVALARLLGREVATPAQARQLIGLSAGPG
ncbi:MAG TPA: 3-keto-5-aminohexanoate cleavage protein [Gaiellaceae bacterium]|jgi:3-keto-5-aminohexanoate cleavage enzyme|nr:3-keto-5-aminohexanoate cleavage protein [Gaiellaceae bacterium]